MEYVLHGLRECHGICAASQNDPNDVVDKVPSCVFRKSPRLFFI